MWRLLVSAGVGYLVGGLPTADTAARLATGGATSLRTAGTGNPGAANAIAVLGKGWGGAVMAADIGKGLVGCAVGRRVAGDNGAHLGGTAAVIGHCFPIWSGFRGGKGVAPSCGQCLATFPAYFPVDLAVAWAVAKWRQRAFTATAVASALWVAAGLLWWQRGWPNAWAPRPTAALPAAAAATSTVILWRFAAAARATNAGRAGPSG
jgi:glycerol-3-phosphate acyltransferase PlsY